MTRNTMLQRLSPIAFGALAAATIAGGGPAGAADAAHPTVVELFQSQGCSSCPPASANVMALADRPDLLTLSWQVTYWDHLGWKDTFDNPAFTRRQYDYAAAFGRSGVFTPEVVVNGRSDVVGNERDQLEALIRGGDRGTGGPIVTIAGDRVTVSEQLQAARPRVAIMVLLVRYDPRIIQVPIRRGENEGRTLPHRNVVRQLVALGKWTGGSQIFPLPLSRQPGLDMAVLLQAGPGGRILAAARG